MSRNARKSVSILGSTGSVGCSTVDLIARHPEKFSVKALSANTNVARLAEQAMDLEPELAVVGSEELYDELKTALGGTGIEVGAGRSAILEAASLEADFTMAAIVGAAGLEPAITAAKNGGTIGLANKECLVSAGEVFLQHAKNSHATVIPVDSEHNAIYQVFDFESPDTVARIILTASGGPFRTYDIKDMEAVTPAQAVAHPNWDMGAKISIDSATMMNKGLELIEAFYLFPVNLEQIDIVVHPQSVIHSMVEYVDGSVLAQLGTPDMRIPIAFSLAWPDRMGTPSARLDLTALKTLTFEAPDPDKFPSIRLARHAIQEGRGLPCVLNAANEVAVASFLAGLIDFLDISNVVEEIMSSHVPVHTEQIEDVVRLDSRIRIQTDALVKSGFLRR